MIAKKHIDILIRDDLRNTGFVFLVLKKARLLNLYGRAGYNADGGVSIEAEGDNEQLELLLEYCRKNPNGGENTQINISTGILRNYYNFEMNVF